MKHPFQPRRLADILVERQFVSADRVALATANGDERLGERLVDDSVLTAEQLAQALAEQFGLPYVDLNGFTISPQLFECLSATQAYQLNVVPYRLNGEAIEVAIADPYDLALPERLERITGLHVKLLLAGTGAIQAALKRSQGSAEVLKDLSEDFRLVMVKETEEGGEQTVSLEKLGDVSSPVVRLVNTLMLDALAKRASDIHIETYDKGIAVKYRIDGVLYSAMETRV
jgi:type IV pilus assembly protein PilB